MTATRMAIAAVGAIMLLTAPALPGTGKTRAGSVVPFTAAPEAPPKAATAARSAPSSDPAVTVGDTYPQAHIVTEPGRYGLSNPPQGEAYAVIGHALVRIDPASFKVLSVLRSIEGRRD